MCCCFRSPAHLWRARASFQQDWWSPDGRWRTEVVSAGPSSAGPERVLIWNTQATHLNAPAAAFKTECIFSADQDDCARLFCEKVALSLQETQLRKVFGSDFELMYGRYKASIHSAHSATRGNM